VIHSTRRIGDGVQTYCEHRLSPIAYRQARQIHRQWDDSFKRCHTDLDDQREDEDSEAPADS